MVNISEHGHCTGTDLSLFFGTILPVMGSVAEGKEIHLHPLNKISCRSQQTLERDGTGKEVN